MPPIEYKEFKPEMTFHDEKVSSESKKGKHKKGNTLASMGIHIQERGVKRGEHQDYEVHKLLLCSNISIISSYSCALVPVLCSIEPDLEKSLP
jgi:hypothetical protein